MADSAFTLADDEQVGVTFSEVDDKGNAVPLAEAVTMTSSDAKIASIGLLHDGVTPAIVATGAIGTCTVACSTPSGLSANIALNVIASAPVGLAAGFGTPEKQ